ncbi:glycopeptide antibiotics resistance protein [Bacillus mesophilus]|uniref:VanZ family protein n=1 Tax=Bacillus mesophilus TaxID=1808955 RepID=A0A6M0Q7H2_9BACI|nr:VanZ family protein [Bacillus mesophilus]MBM7661624.1 glycopeptide antibiotics resistance protein [Bacillus mesophilus]NEY72292.1 hypothetical protein [Bacillus mesophilus]
MLNHINVDIMFGIDKQMHFWGFFVGTLILGILLLLITPIRYSRRNLSILWFGVIMIGMIEEFRQYLLPNRSTEFLDGMANILGATCGILLPFIIGSFYKQLVKNKHLYMLFFFYILTLSAGLWQLNQISFLQEELNLRNIVQVFFMK